MELENVTPVWSEIVWPSITYSLWLWAPWKWKRPFSSLAKPGVEVTICSMAREATAAGALAMYDLSMAMWLWELSVSSWATLIPAVTLIDSESWAMASLTVVSMGTAE